MVRKALVRLRGLVSFIWYKTVYRNAFLCQSIPKLRKGLSLVIDKGGTVVFGKAIFVNNYCSFNCKEEIRIGNNCLFGEGVKIYDHDHRFRDINKPIFEQGFKCAPVVIGDNVWVGSSSIILKGVTIGSNVVIGAGCVIDHDVASGTIVKRESQQDTIPWEPAPALSAGE